MASPAVRALLFCLALMTLAGSAAGETLSCRGDIVSKQGEGLVVRTYRFEVGEVTGGDLNEVLEKCRRIALQRQNKAARSTPGVPFKKVSDLDLECTRGTEKLQVRRTLQTVSSPAAGSPP